MPRMTASAEAQPPRVRPSTPSYANSDSYPACTEHWRPPQGAKCVVRFQATSTKLDAATRQGIAHAVTKVNGCNYCDAMCTWVSRRLTHLGADEIASNRSGSSTDARRAAALAFAGEVALTRGEVADDLLAAVREAGFSDAQIFDIVALVVQFSMTNCLLCVSVGSGQMLASGGGPLNVLLHCGERRPTKGPSQLLRRPVMGIPLQRRAVGLVMMVEVASTVVKTRDVSGASSAFQSGESDAPRESVMAHG